MKRLLIILLALVGFAGYGQINRDQLALDVSNANAANMKKLQALVWNQQAVVTVDGQQNQTRMNQVSINDSGKVVITNLDASSNVKQKPGIRGRIQQDVQQQNADYVEKALELALSYAFMTKGQLVDFFDKAQISESNGEIVASGTSVLVSGDKVTLKVNSTTHLLVQQSFSSVMDGDPISGAVNYATFSTGVNHIESSVLNIPAKKAVIKTQNSNYVQKVM